MDLLPPGGKRSVMAVDGELRSEIRSLIRKSENGIGFAQFMSLALYHPVYGYYSQGPVIGKGGDFFTSVSVGACFGMLLARQIRQIRDQLGAPEGFAVLEQGAHWGELAFDILQEFGEVDYRIAEPSSRLRAMQIQKLSEHAEVRSGWKDWAPAQHGVFLCNELLDALPFMRVQFAQGEWSELRVVEDDAGGFQEAPFPLEDARARQLLPETAIEGFTTELCLAAEDLLGEVYQAMDRGVAIFIDYGMGLEDYFAPERKEGTRRCYRKHRATDDPFEEIGGTDITAQVNFSHVAGFAREVGFDVLGYTDQNRFLTGIAESWLLEMEGKPPSPGDLQLIRQFQTLTQPGGMGRLFKVLVLGKAVSGLELDGLKRVDILR